MPSMKKKPNLVTINDAWQIVANNQCARWTAALIMLTGTVKIEEKYFVLNAIAAHTQDVGLRENLEEKKSFLVASGLMCLITGGLAVGWPTRKINTKSTHKNDPEP